MAAINDDPARAVELFEQALAVYGASGQLSDALRARRRLAAALLCLPGPAPRAAAAAALSEARATAERVGATRELRQIATLEAALAPAPASPRTPAPVATGQARALDALTPRELEVLALITRGLSNRAIAEQLVISEKTAEVHVRNILGKLGFSSRTQAATYAVERGLMARSA